MYSVWCLWLFFYFVTLWTINCSLHRTLRAPQCSVRTWGPPDERPQVGFVTEPERKKKNEIQIQRGTIEKQACGDSMYSQHAMTHSYDKAGAMAHQMCRFPKSPGIFRRDQSLVALLKGRPREDGGGALFQQHAEEEDLGVQRVESIDMDDSNVMKHRSYTVALKLMTDPENICCLKLTDTKCKLILRNVLFSK